MKILIHSNGPMVQTGYGNQVKLLAPRLKADGHDVAISAFYGLSGSPITWEGIPILPAGQMEYGADVLAQHAINHGADLVITLMDFWKLNSVAEELKGLKVLSWLPVDCDPLSKMDRNVLLRSGAQPLAMSAFGEKVLTDSGFSPLYAPHAVDTKVFKPVADRTALRTELGLDDFFLIGICSANKDALRKGWPEQFEAFRRFSQKAPDARLMVHSVARCPAGFMLDQLAEDMGIADKVIFSDQYAQIAGLMDSATMADWFNCLDVLSTCSYAEAFGVPLVEAQACGTPTIATKGSAMEEISTRVVKADPFWNPMHRAWWQRPRVDDIVKAYRESYAMRGTEKAQKWRDGAVFTGSTYDADVVYDTYWKKVLEQCA